MLSVYDKAVTSSSLSTLASLSLVAAVMFIILGAMEVLRSRLLISISSRIDKALGTGLHERVFINAVKVGGDKATASPLHDLHGLRQFITGNGVLAVFDAPWVPIYLLIMFLFHPMIGTIGLIASLILLVIAVLNQVKSGDHLALSNVQSRLSQEDTMRGLRNAEAVATMGMLPHLSKSWRARQDRLLAHQEAASRPASFYNALIKTIRLATQSTAIGAGAYLVINQEISPGMLIAGSILVGRALQPVEIAVGSWRGFIESRGQFQRLNELFCSIPIPQEKMALPPISGHIKVVSAVIVPPGSDSVAVNYANLEIPAGTVATIIGPSGSGKTSLIRGLLGLWPTVTGEIRIDGTEATSYSRSELGPQIGYLPQDIELLEGSVSGNIARFGEVDAEAVVAAALAAGVHELILSLPNGYDTVVGQSGGMLSPGQRQRIGLARALYGWPRLVVLDEANSNLDETGEQALIAAMMTLKQRGSTVILVSHRQNVLPVSDMLIIMNKTRVLNCGPTAEVIAAVEAASQSKQTDGTVV
jgi:ATP-binding cassette subfamily C protein EexD